MSGSWCQCAEKMVDPAMCNGCFAGEEDEDGFLCDHEDYELDILIGRAKCPSCGHDWYMSAAELKRHHELMAQPYPCNDETDE